MVNIWGYFFRSVDRHPSEMFPSWDRVLSNIHTILIPWQMCPVERVEYREAECQNLIKMSNCQELYQGGAATSLTYTLSNSILSKFYFDWISDIKIQDIHKFTHVFGILKENEFYFICWLRNAPGITFLLLSISRPDWSDKHEINLNLQSQYNL